MPDEIAEGDLTLGRDGGEVEDVRELGSGDQLSGVIQQGNIRTEPGDSSKLEA